MSQVWQMYLCKNIGKLGENSEGDISAIMPPPNFYRKYAPLFSRPVFSKFFGRRCLVEGLVSAPAHPLPPPKTMSTPTNFFLRKLP